MKLKERYSFLFFFQELHWFNYNSSKKVFDNKAGAYYILYFWIKMKVHSIASTAELFFFSDHCLQSTLNYSKAFLHYTIDL